MSGTNGRGTTDHRRAALRKAWGKGRGKARRAAYLVARENLKRQLRERNHPYLFLGRSYVQLGLGLVGAGPVLVTALLAPATVNITSGERTADAQMGLLPSVRLVASLVELAGLLLSFPYGRRDKFAAEVALRRLNKSIVGWCSNCAVRLISPHQLKGCAP